METKDIASLAIAVAAIAVGAITIVACFRRVDAILKKDDQLWSDMPETIQK